MSTNKSAPRLSDDEISTLEEMQAGLLKMYRKSASLVRQNEDKDLTWEVFSTMSNARASAGKCAEGYAAVTDLLRRAKPAP